MGVRDIFSDLRAALRQALAHFRLRDQETGAPHPTTTPAPAIDCSLRTEWLDPACEFPVPDWNQVGNWIDGFPEEQHQLLWCNVARHWATRMAKAFGGGCNVFETANIFAVIPGDIARGKRAIRHYEEILASLRTTLGAMALPAWHGKFTLFIAPDQDAYYRYHSLYCRPGEHIQSGGVYLNRGYGHIVLPSPDIMFQTRVVAHELCHALLCHHPLPLWLNEGVTQIAEAAIAGRPFIDGHSKTIKDHRAFWTSENITLFWGGQGFDTPGDTSALSYDLAYLIVQAFLALDRARMAAVVCRVDPGDAGFTAFREVYGQTPADLLAEMFGPGTWENGYTGTTPRAPLTG